MQRWMISVLQYRIGYEGLYQPYDHFSYNRFSCYTFADIVFVLPWSATIYLFIIKSYTRYKKTNIQIQTIQEISRYLNP